MSISTQLAKGKMHASIALLSIGWLLITTPAEAKRITVQQAQQNAINFMGSKMALNTKSQFNITRSTQQTDAYYVFSSTDGKGYVIVAGDDAVRPILGYSTQGTFDPTHLPEGLKDLLLSYQKQIEALGDNAPTYQKTRASEDNSEEKLLATAHWNQEAPFNEYTPNNYPTGCVATAGAIIMKHWAYPAKGTGSHSYIWNKTEQLSANFEHEYDWGNMPKEYIKGENDDQFHGVARLMSDVGISVEMNYQKDGSAASNIDLLNSLIKYFGYSKYANLQSWYSYSDSEWKAKIKENINANRPVIYAASDESQGGHMFVIDGYNKDNLFSVNWGWGGYCNGFYAIGQLNPNEDYGFNIGDQAIFDLQPSDGKEVISPLRMAKDLDYFYGINMNATDVKAKQAVKMYFSPVSCQASEGFKGKLYICLTDKDGNLKEKLAYMKVDLQYGYGYNQAIAANFTPKNDAEAGDRITLMTNADGSDEMIPIKGFDNSDISIPATGYTPRTSTIQVEAGDGATVTPATDNVLYNDMPLQGSDYVFAVTVGNDVAKSFVTVNGKLKTPEETNSSTSGNGSMTYAIHATCQPSYTIKVKAYKEYAEKKFELEVTPGSLEKALTDQDIDYLLYRDVKLKGQIDQRDFTVLNEYPFRKIDLSECSVTAYSYYEADMVPDLAFESNETLEYFEMPKGVKSLGNNAFFASQLKKITIPETVEKVENDCFFYCNQLNDVYMYHTTPLDYTYDVFAVSKTIAANRTLHVPAGTKTTYENSAYSDWTQYFGKIVEDVETGIQGVHVNAASDATAKKAAIYDLNGRRIVAPAKNQTYIQNGKKFIQR